MFINVYLRIRSEELVKLRSVGEERSKNIGGDRGGGSEEGEGEHGV